MMIMLVFGWAFFCFFLVTVGDQLLFGLSKMVRSGPYRKMLLESGQAIGAIMVGGSVMLVLTIAAAQKYPKMFLAAFVFGLTFANARFRLVHDVGFIVKYLAIVYLGGLSALFLYKNFWRLISIPYVRIAIAHLAWMGGVCFFLGGRTADIWYFGTELCVVVGFCTAWFYRFNNEEGLEQFIYVLAWTGLAITLVHMSAPFIAKNYISQGRFQSVFVKATGFSVAYTPIVIILFWMAMAHRDARVRTFFVGVATVGMLLILWSGSRAPTAAILMGVGIMWLFFRSQILLAILGLAVFAAALQILFSISSGIETSTLTSRMGSTDSGRFELWVRYFEVGMQSPIYGTAPSRLGYAIVNLDRGGGLAAFLAKYSLNVSNKGIHNSYLGVFMRFGLVGLFIFLSMLILPMRRAYQVLRAKEVPREEKRLYVLPAALIPAIMFTLMFEDKVPGPGKGTVSQLLLYISAFICQIYGTRLLNEHVRTKETDIEIRTIEGFEIGMSQAKPL